MDHSTSFEFIRLFSGKNNNKCPTEIEKDLKIDVLLGRKLNEK